jgi:hypothetical protein
VLAMIIAIGNSPSSGSTFLADILDSLPFAVCGVEINLFSVKDYFSNFNHIKYKKEASSPSPLIYQTRQRFLRERLCAYGIEKSLLDIILKNVKTFEDFCMELFSTFSNIRGKECSIFFEKTPQNIHCAKEFLETFPNSYFLHIVRNPLFVYKSLIKRNMPNYIARNTWIVDVSAAYSMEQHPRFITIRYEDLVKNPFDVVANFIKEIGFNVNRDELKKLYFENKYRQTVSRKIKSWSINKYGSMGDANKKKITAKEIKNLQIMSKSKISKKYASLFGINPVSFSKLVNFYGYNLDDLLFDQHTQGTNNSDFKSQKILFKKFLLDFLHCDASINSLFSYLKPVETCVE